MAGLWGILVSVLALPFFVKTIERNLEIFLFIMGVAAVGVSGILHRALVVQALVNPVGITFAVLCSGLLFKWFHNPLKKAVDIVHARLPFPILMAALVLLLGVISSVITAIISALVLAMAVNLLDIKKEDRVRFAVIACFSIGLGAALTPLGEPLSTITIRKLNGDFFYLIRLIGPEILLGILTLAIYAAVTIRPTAIKERLHRDLRTESYEEIINRSIKIYLFVMALTLLGAGFEPFIRQYLMGISPESLYWMNMVSAVLDNATLAAAEISPDLSRESTKSILLGLLISGGMLIPGNIPNIIASGKLAISSKEWARCGFPIGMVLMILYFALLFWF